MNMNKLILPQIKKALENKFVKWEAVGEILSSRLTMKKPVILYGRGRHGKSEMVRAVFEVLSESASDFGIQSFGEGMSEAKLFGGLNLKSLNCPENPKMEFAPENSFLAKSGRSPTSDPVGQRGMKPR